MRGTVSTLCASTCGADAKTSASSAGLPEKSGISSSTPQPGSAVMDRADRLGVQPGALVGKVVAGNAGDRRVAQPHRRHRLGDAPRLVAVERLRLAGVDLAEVAAPGAGVTADQERRLAVFPAFEDVGAARLLADGVQALAPHQVGERGVLRAGAQPGPDPRRLALDGGLGVAGLEREAAAGRPGAATPGALMRRPPRVLNWLS